MGCGSPQESTIPNIPSNHLNRLLQVSDIHHPLNVNKKYEHIQKILLDEEAGEGFKKTYHFQSLTTQKQLKNKISQYWETRTSGNPAIWSSIRCAVEQPNQTTGLLILKQKKIHMLNDNIQMCVDHKFSKYEVPIFCINPPKSFSELILADKNLSYEYDDKEHDIKIKSTKYPGENLIVKQKASVQIKIVKQVLKGMKSLSDETTIRFFYNGRQMLDDRALGNYGYKEGTVIQAMIS